MLTATLIMCPHTDKVSTQLHNVKCDNRQGVMSVRTVLAATPDKVSLGNTVSMLSVTPDKASLVFA